ncbi:MAG TPA: NYN domain-containing protein [Rhodospirillales bacterium]|nr:NYN domain-containing protein [Rhodospirillales bacterium]
MDRVAVFVDAGYLFAQGSTALTGSKKARESLVLDAPKAIGLVKSVASQKAPDCSLLRVYWYDGAIGGIRPTTDQALLANLDDVKLRLGFVNSYGQQKGVDSLIVTDLIELARLNSISDAVLLSGDEDVRVGVQIAQNYGVRIHLLGITPSRGSQSNQLLQEADTTTEWGAGTIGSCLSVRQSGADETKEAVEFTTSESSLKATEEDQISAKIEASVQTFVAALTEVEIEGIVAYWRTERGVPPEFDGKMLPICRAAIGRNLERPEIKHLRTCFQQCVKDRLK